MWLWLPIRQLSITVYKIMFEKPQKTIVTKGNIQIYTNVQSFVNFSFYDEFNYLFYIFSDMCKLHYLNDSKPGGYLYSLRSNNQSPLLWGSSALLFLSNCSFIHEATEEKWKEASISLNFLVDMVDVLSVK